MPEQPVVVGEARSEEESQESDLTEVPEEGEISDETVNPSENPDSNTTESEETISEDDEGEPAITTVIMGLAVI